MAHEDLTKLVEVWIEDYKKNNVLWEIKENSSSDNVIVSGSITINVGEKSHLISGSCTTHNDDDSIGRAIQSLNDKIFMTLT